MLTSELASADDPAASESASGSSSEADAEEDARNEALGLGGAKLKAVLSEINKNSQLGMNGASNIPVKGGEVLAIVHERLQNMSGDPAAKRLYGVLMQAAGKPYVDMVHLWIRTGKLTDPYEELCVKESKFIDRGILDLDYTDEYWERRYTVCTSDSIQGFVNISSSCAMDRQSGERRSDIKREYPHLEHLEVGSQAGHAYLLSLSGGSTRCCLRASISMSYRNVASRLARIHNQPMRNCRWRTTSKLLHPFVLAVCSNGPAGSTKSSTMHIPTQIARYCDCCFEISNLYPVYDPSNDISSCPSRHSLHISSTLLEVRCANLRSQRPSSSSKAYLTLPSTRTRKAKTPCSGTTSK